MVFAKHIRFFSKSSLLILSLNALQMFAADGIVKLPSPYEIINGQEGSSDEGLRTKCLKFNNILVGWAIKQEKGQSAVNLCTIIANHAGLLKMDHLPQPIRDPKLGDAALLIHKVHTNINFARIFYALGGHSIIELTLQVISEGCSKLDGSTVLSPEDVSESLAKCTKHIQHYKVATQLVSPPGDYRFTYGQSCSEVIDLPNPIERLKQAIKQCKNSAIKNIIHERLNADLSTACDVQQEQINNKNITINSLHEQRSQLNKQIEALEKENGILIQIGAESQKQSLEQKENTAKWQKMWYEEHEKNAQLTDESNFVIANNKELAKEIKQLKAQSKQPAIITDCPKPNPGAQSKSKFWSLPNFRYFLAGSFFGGIGTFSILKSSILATFFKFAWFAQFAV